MPHWNALKYDEYEPRELNFDSALSICQDDLKIENFVNQPKINFRDKKIY